MYANFYGLRGKPFSLLPDPEFLFLSDKHRMALTLLEYGLMNQASFSVITGDIGAGKTTLIRRLLNQLDRDLTVGLISNTHPSFGELLHWILLAFNIDYSGKDKVGMYSAFVDFLIREYAANRRTILIIDEAQNMSHQALEELRMLSNVNVEKDQVLQVILVGQPGLREHLRDPGLEQFAQRIAVDYHLGPLGPDETRSYIRHRLEVVGGDPSLFSDDACEVIFQNSGGIPRLINILCDTALVYGYAEQRAHIDAQLANDVVIDKQKGSILPLRQATVDSQLSEAGDTPIAQSAKNKPTSLYQGKKKLRIIVASDSETQRTYLKMVLERSGAHVVSVVSVSEQLPSQVGQEDADVVLMDLDEHIERKPGFLENLLDQLHDHCRVPVLFNDSSATGSDTTAGDLGKKLSLKLTSLMGRW
jgi:type II secretory pathway predicted ATPase ExeA